MALSGIALVTGGAGFIGSHIASALAAAVVVEGLNVYPVESLPQARECA